MAGAKPRAGEETAGAGRLLDHLLGAILGLSLIKFGNPTALDPYVTAPSNSLEWMFQAWPVHWAYGLLLPVAALLIMVRWAGPKPFSPAIWLLPAWFGWEMVSGAFSSDPAMTRLTLVHFASVVLVFGAGLLARASERTLKILCGYLFAGLFYAMWTGFTQHYGGLQAMREEFYKQPNWQASPHELILKIESDRIFGTLVYPNALAGAVLLLSPALGVWIHQWKTARLPRQIALGLLVYMSGACLMWSKSKSAWLIAVLLAAGLLLRLRINLRLKQAAIVLLLVLGLAGFGLRFAGYFKKGATSVAARFDYWRAAIQITREHPLVGAGPGAFAKPYARLKRPDAEMARLVHNDYLEQASDSGIPGFALYLAFWAVMLMGIRQVNDPAAFPLATALWFGVASWALQGLVEFGLYIPALAWPAFFFLGWLAKRQSVPPSTASH